MGGWEGGRDIGGREGGWDLAMDFPQVQLVYNTPPGPSYHFYSTMFTVPMLEPGSMNNPIADEA